MVVLNGRSVPSADVSAAIADMNANGGRVEVITGDIAEPGTAARLVAAVEDAGLRPAGVLHSAIVLADEIVLNMSESAAARVFAPKVAGSWWLHEATADLDLDWWLTFSSAASLLGSPGQGAYAAANSWVDGLVAYRRSRGLPAIGINWGPWADVGRAQFFADLGFSMITAETGDGRRCNWCSPRTGRARGCSASTPGSGSSPSRRPRSRRCSPDSANRRRRERRDGGRIRAELDAVEPGARPARLASAIADEIRAVLRSTESLDHDQAMESLGLDSLMALELRNRLEASLGITLPVALVWAYPTISGLAGALCERMGYAPADERPKPQRLLNRNRHCPTRRWICSPTSSRPASSKPGRERPSRDKPGRSRRPDCRRRRERYWRASSFARAPCSPWMRWPSRSRSWASAAVSQAT